MKLCKYQFVLRDTYSMVFVDCGKIKIHELCCVSCNNYLISWNLESKNLSSELLTE